MEIIYLWLSYHSLSLLFHLWSPTWVNLWDSLSQSSVSVFTWSWSHSRSGCRRWNHTQRRITSLPPFTFCVKGTEQAGVYSWSFPELLRGPWLGGETIHQTIYFYAFPMQWVWWAKMWSFCGCFFFFFFFFFFFLHPWLFNWWTLWLLWWLVYLFVVWDWVILPLLI